MTKNQNVKDNRMVLIESSDFLSKIKLPKDLKEAVQMSAGKAGTLIVKNIPCTILNRVNQNGRIYSTEVVQAAIDEANQLHAFETKQLLSQACEHPEGSFVSPTTASHVVIASYIKKNIEVIVEGKKGRFDVLFQDWEVLNTVEGKNLRALFEAECSIGTSIRGVGDMNGKYVENYSLLGCDCVGNPSSSTFTRMPVSESVKVELRDPRNLTETFTVSTSSTNVVRDLENAAQLQAQLDSIGYGTVTKTSTKLDSEVDPKTGAETTITTLEAETEDEVTDIDQALMLAKNAMLNGTVNIDSITIEKNEEDTPKESVEKTDNTLEEDRNNLGLKKITDVRGVQIVGPNEDLLWRLVKELRDYKDHNSMEWQRSYKSLKDAGVDQEYLDYANGKDMTANEATETKLNEDVDWGNDKNLFKTLHHIKDGVIEKDGVTFDFIPLDDGNVKVITKFPIPSADGGEEWETGNEVVSYDKARRYWHRLESSGLYTYKLDETTITEAKKDDPNAGKKFVLKCPAGFVAMDGNALVFKQDPKEALHFIVGKEESGLVHLSGVEKILDTMGVYDVEKYYRKDLAPTTNTNEESAEENKLNEVGDVSINTGDIASNNDIDIPFIGEETIKEENGKNTKYVANVHLIENDDIVETKEIPVSATEYDSLLKEVANLYKQKAENESRRVEITIVDTTNNTSYWYNSEENKLEPLEDDLNQPTEQPIGESDGEIKQDGNKLSLELDDNNTIEKEFDSPVQAKVTKAALEQDKVDGNVMLNEEDDEESETAKCAWCGEEFEKSALRKEKDLGYLCNSCIKAIQSRGEPLTFEESDNMNEVLYSAPTQASDDYVEQPLNDATEENLTITLNNIDWDVDSIVNSFASTAEDDDIATEGDLMSLINDLPDTLTLEINAQNFESDEDIDNVKSKLLDLASKNAGLRINNATIVDVK